MKKGVLISLMALAGMASSIQVEAVQIFESGYIIEEYLTYSHATQAAQMAFDDSGNLYLTYGSGGTLDRIAADKTVSTIATGLVAPRNIVWTGGTAFGLERGKVSSCQKRID